jgi:tetratricopeptide (TPR) repeat protein
VPDPPPAPAPTGGASAETAAAAPPTDAAQAAHEATPELERTLIIDMPSFVEQPPVDPTVILDGPSPDEALVDPTIVIDAGDLPELPLPQRTILLREVPQLTPVDLRRLEILNTYQGLKTRNHFEVLGVSRDATEAQVREAYFRLAKRFHPDGQHEADLSGTRDALEAIFRRLGQAYEVLRNPRIRAAYERNLAAAPVPPPADASGPLTGLFEAPDAAIARAAESFAADRLWEVVQILEKAVPRSQGAVKQRQRVLLARAYARTPDWVKQAEELLLTVVQQDPSDADAHFHLGVIYQGQGLRSRALRAFRRVLELAPGHPQAQRHLAEVERRRHGDR